MELCDAAMNTDGLCEGGGGRKLQRGGRGATGRRKEGGGRWEERGGAALQMGSAEGWVFNAYLNIITFKILNIVSIQMESWGGAKWP